MTDPNEVLVRNVERWIAEFRAYHGHQAAGCPEAVSQCGHPFRAPQLPPGVRDPIMNMIAGRVFVWWRGELDYAVGKCESPIEELLLLCLAAEGLIAGDEIYFNRLDFEPFSCGGAIVAVKPQVQIGKYRIDFQVGMWIRTVLQSSDQEEWRAATILVECDGHDFHDRTKEQASRDRERDRDLQTAGFQIFRYTGADLWRDAMSHARELLHAVWEKAMKSEPLAVRERKPRV